eukprot:gene11525-11668_t
MVAALFIQARELQQPNTNLDDLALLLRDKLMPLRVWWMRHGPGGPAQFRKALEHKRLGVPGVVNFVDARTQWVDQMVDSSLSHCNIHQVVCIAAGFDTRAYRFGRRHTDVQFYEVDLPSASRKKQQMVQQLFVPQCNYPRPVYIAADLSKEDLARMLLGSNNSTTAGTGFDPSLPTLFTLEGLIYYLPEAAVKRLFAALLSIAAPGSRLVFDFLHKKVLEGRVPQPPAYKVTALSVANKGEPFLSGIEDSPAAVARFMNSIPGSDSTTAPDTPGTSDQRATGSSKGYKLLEYLDPKDIMAKQLPHLQWDDNLPPILSFYSYAAFEVQSMNDW